MRKLAGLGLFVLLGACSSTGGGGGDADGEPAAPPEALWGSYDLRLLGDWNGACGFMISTGALLEDLHVENDRGELDMLGQHHARDVEEIADGLWDFVFIEEFRGMLGPEDHTWEFLVAEGDVTGAGWTGSYRHTTESAGTMEGELRATRR